MPLKSKSPVEERGNPLPLTEINRNLNCIFVAGLQFD